MTNYNINLQAYIKLIMHSLRFPYAKVNGLLLSHDKSKSSSKKSSTTSQDQKDVIEFVDYIPLFHFNQGLTPMLEIALIQIQAYCVKHHLQIAAYFQANKNFHDASIDIFAQRIREKLVEHYPSVSIAILNSFNLTESLSKKDVSLDNTLNIHEQIDGRFKTSPIGFDLKDQKVIDAIQFFVFKKQEHLNLNDFDCHLHDIKCDWFNNEINRMIVDWSSQTI